MFSKLILNPDIEWEQVVRKGIAQKIILFYENGFRLLFGRSGSSKKKHCYITKINDFHLNHRFSPNFQEPFFSKINFQHEKNLQFFFSFFFSCSLSNRVPRKRFAQLSEHSF